jgi:hypothetical protein
MLEKRELQAKKKEGEVVRVVQEKAVEIEQNLKTQLLNL